MPAAKILQSFLLRLTTETSSSTCTLLARLQQPTFTSELIRTRVKLPEPTSTHSLRMFFDCTPCKNLLAQIEKQLKLIPSPLQTSGWNMKSHTQHIKANVWQEANIHEHINNIHRETTQTMNLNQNFLLLIQMPVHGCSSQYSLIALLFSWMLDNVTMYKGGCLYSVSLSSSKAIKSRI